jgi:hypothetical protein
VFGGNLINQSIFQVRKNSTLSLLVVIGGTEKKIYCHATTVKRGYNDIGLFDTSPIEDRLSVVPISLLKPSGNFTYDQV